MIRSDMQEMAKKHWTDIIILALCLGIGYFIAAKPRITEGDLSYQKIPSPAKRVRPIETAKPEHLLEVIPSYANIEKNNIFSAQRSYEVLPAGTPTDRPYQLIAVLKGNDRRAIFRDYKGSLVSRKPGEKLDDGSEVVQIGDTFVSLQKGTERREQRIFAIKPPADNKVVK